VPGAAPVLSQCLQAPAGHHRLVFNHVVEDGSSGQSAIISGFRLSAIFGKPSPVKAGATPNPHRRQAVIAFPRVRPSEAFRRRPPILGHSLAPGRHPKPLCGRPPPRKGLVAAGDGSGRLRSCVRPWCAAMSTAGPDGLRGSAPKHHGGVYAPKGFPGCSDPRFDRSPSCCCPCKRQVRMR